MDFPLLYLLPGKIIIIKIKINGILLIFEIISIFGNLKLKYIIYYKNNFNLFKNKIMRILYGNFIFLKNLHF